MKQVMTSQKIPIKLWLDDMESGALDQAKNLANLPFAFKHIAIMPDAHHGYGMPIGGVLAIQNAIIPNAVGVDIGCGMCAVRTNLTHIEKTDIQKWVGILRQTIPTGFKHNIRKNDDVMPDIRQYDLDIVLQEFGSAAKQIGTLGGGNHFIEIQKGSDKHIWLMVHSGSRNLGKKVADHYIAEAKKLNTRWKSEVPPSWDLAFLPLDSEEGHLYKDEMQYCVSFALANRALMLQQMTAALVEVMGSDVEFRKPINIAHNYAAMENHFGQNVMVHRKGATRAYKGEPGIIPGCQGSSSYIVSGKGNPDSFKSCSHGAGRTMSRAKAKDTLILEDEQKKLDDMGVVHGMRNRNDLDEAPGAYKDIQVVMDNQSDLVNIEVELKPLGVLKGPGKQKRGKRRHGQK